MTPQMDEGAQHGEGDRSAIMWRRSPAASHGGEPVLDLDYAEDSDADTDANFVMTGKGGIVEVRAPRKLSRSAKSNSIN